MPKSSLIVLKLGGSVITAKDAAAGSVRRLLIQEIGRALVAYLTDPHHHLVLLHGAGAPGHRLAKRFDLAKGVRNDRRKKAAVSHGQKLTAELHQTVLKTLRSAGVPVTSINPSAVIRQQRGQLRSIALKPVRDALRKKMVPVLYGDLVPDTTWRFSICSADASSAYLARALQADQLLYATDTDGIFSDDPHVTASARLIQQTTLASLRNTQARLTHSHSHDVTGGMWGKVASVLHHTKKGQPKNIVVFNGLSARRYAPALNGTLKRCTRIRNKKSG